MGRGWRAGLGNLRGLDQPQPSDKYCRLALSPEQWDPAEERRLGLAWGNTGCGYPHINSWVCICIHLLVSLPANTRAPDTHFPCPHLHTQRHIHIHLPQPQTHTYAHTPSVYIPSLVHTYAHCWIPVHAHIHKLTPSPLHAPHTQCSHTEACTQVSWRVHTGPRPDASACRSAHTLTFACLRSYQQIITYFLEHKHTHARKSEHTPLHPGRDTPLALLLGPRGGRPLLETADQLLPVVQDGVEALLQAGLLVYQLVLQAPYPLQQGQPAVHH